MYCGVIKQEVQACLFSIAGAGRVAQSEKDASRDMCRGMNTVRNQALHRQQLWFTVQTKGHFV